MERPCLSSIGQCRRRNIRFNPTQNYVRGGWYNRCRRRTGGRHRHGGWGPAIHAFSETSTASHDDERPVALAKRFGYFAASPTDYPPNQQVALRIDRMLSIRTLSNNGFSNTLLTPAASARARTLGVA